MSILNVPHYSTIGSHDSLLSNVAKALRAAASTLFAAKPAAKAVEVKDAAVSKADRDELFRLARAYEDVNPGLAAELRFFGRQ